MRYSCHRKKLLSHSKLIWELDLLICLPYCLWWYLETKTVLREYEMFPTPELTAVSAVRRSGDCISPASSLLLVPPGPSYPAEHRDSLQRPGSATTSGPGLGPTQSCPSQQNYKESFWWNYLFHGKREIQAKLGSSCRFISVLIPFRLLQKEHCKILRK